MDALQEAWKVHKLTCEPILEVERSKTEYWKQKFEEQVDIVERRYMRESLYLILGIVLGVATAHVMFLYG